MRQNMHTLISIAILAFMVLMIIAAIMNLRRGGSLDDLSASEIKARVDGA